MTAVVDAPRPTPSAAPTAGSSRRRAWTAWVTTSGPELTLGLAAFVLFAWGLSKNGFGNSYYASAVRSMSSSWKNFFYGVLDPGGWITLDKPPLAVWLQALSVRVLGYSTWSLLLPSAACGAASVVLLAATVRRVWGRVAGLAAGVARALTPALLAVSRSNNPDVTLVLCLVAAAYATQRAISDRAPWWMVAAGVLCGLGFLAKLLAAGLVMPGLWLAYLLTGPGGWWRRVRDLLVAAGAFVAVAAGWVLLVDHLPATNRPFVGGSTDGTALDLVFGYDGFGRLTGRGSGPGGGGGPGGGFAALSRLGGGIDQFGGPAGIGRLFNAGMGDQVMWLAVFAALALVAGLALAIRRRRLDAETGSLVMWGGWAIVTYVVLAFAQGIFHNYYVAVLAPAVAALAGVGVELARRGGRAAAAVVAAAALATAALQLVLLRRVDAYEPLRVVVPLALVLVAFVASLLAAGVALPKVTIGRVALVTLGAGLVAAAVWTWSGTRQAQSGTFPDARPAVNGTGPGGAPGGIFGALTRSRAGVPGTSLPSAERTWLRNRQGKARWMLAVQSSMQSDAGIIAGDSIMPMGGFSGGDPAMTPARLAGLVARGDLRFVSPGGGFGGFVGPGGRPGGAGSRPGNADVSQAVTQACARVPASKWGGRGQSNVYDCRGQAARIRAARAAPSTSTAGGAPGGGAPGAPGGAAAAGFQQVQRCLERRGVDLSAGPTAFTNPRAQAALRACGAPAGPGGAPGAGP